jgi:phage terminase Nu1 subunit (DNA packaging protein)
MINAYRSAFANEKKEDPIENNLDNVVNLTQQKLKELNNKHQDKLRENNLLKAQANLIENDVKFLENEIAKKNLTVPSLEQETEKVEREIQQSEQEYKSGLKEYNIRI